MKQPRAEPVVAINAYNGIHRGCAVDNNSINASTLLGSGTKVESSRATTNNPKGPKVMRYSKSRERVFVNWCISSFN
jgi:hypothetical protein